MDVVKRLAIPLAGAHQLNDPGGTYLALTDGVSRIVCSELPLHHAAMAGLDIGDDNREVPVAAELGEHLLMQPALVVFDRQEQVGALLGGELKTRARCGVHPPESLHPQVPQVPACSALS